jgi:copper chaperone CopZ
MHFNIPINHSDIIVLCALAVLFLLGIRVVISFFRSPKPVKAFSGENRILKNGTRITITIDGMMCGMCEIHIKDAIRKALPESKNLTADHTHGTASFTLSQTLSQKNLEEILHANMDAQGYRLLAVTIGKRTGL